MTIAEHLPRLQWLGRTNLEPDHQHSVLIAVLRGAAAVEVVAAHLRAQLFPSLKSLPDPALWYQVLAFFTGFAHQAVVVFFVLSGWLVGGSFLNKLQLGAPGLLQSYAIDRITRLWIVLVPAFVLTLLISMIVGTVMPQEPDFSPANPYSLLAFVGNLAGLQDMAVPRFGGNFALWSLAYETWYYILFPLMLLPVSGKRLPARIGAVALCAALFVCLNSDLILYFSIWLLGVGFSRLRIDATARQRRLLLAALLVASVYFRLTGSNDILVAASFGQDLLLSTLFLCYLCSLQFAVDSGRWSTRLARSLGAALAAFSFTLYVIHVPLLILLRHLLASQVATGLDPHDLVDLGTYLLLLAAIVALAYLFHLPFEAQTVRLRRVIKELLAWDRARPGELLT